MSKSVSIMGSGNMAFQLLTAFDKASIPLAGLISRDLSRGAETLETTKAKCELVGGRDLRDLQTDIIILAVPDDAIEGVLKFYQFNPTQLIVHTSGAEPMTALKHEKVGVFYPLQTITWGESVDFSKVPILIEGSDFGVENSLLELGKSISSRVQVVSSEDRLKIHLAAVLVSNFTNHLYNRAEYWLKENGYSLDILYPLMEETIRKAKSLGPSKAQTGPAKRGDVKTMSRHEELLTEADLKELYRVLSMDITKF